MHCVHGQPPRWTRLSTLLQQTLCQSGLARRPLPLRPFSLLHDDLSLQQGHDMNVEIGTICTDGRAYN